MTRPWCGGVRQAPERPLTARPAPAPTTRTRPFEDLCDDLLADFGRNRADDIALLVLRLTPPAAAAPSA